MTTAFVFPGQGTQWPGMGIELRERDRAFARRLDECDEALRPHTGWSVVDELAGRRFEHADVVQPVLWAVMVSLAAAWEAAGIGPDVVVGHSQGEIAAACVAGALSLDDAARAIALRSRAVEYGLGEGAMACVSAPEDEVAQLAAAWAGRLHVAAVNGVRTVVVAGPRADVEAFGNCARADRIGCQQIEVRFAAHTEQVEPLEDEIRQSLAALRPRAPRVPMRSTVTGTDVGDAEVDAAYLYRNLREPVRFAPVIESLAAEGVDTFVEVSPHPVLVRAIRETVGLRGVAVGTLSRRLGQDAFAQSLAVLQARVAGPVAIDDAPALRLVA